VQLGYWLSCEEHAPQALVRHAVASEHVGFGFALASDHFHPWVPAQGQSPFVWSVLGAIAHATERITIGTGVSAPIHRLHPVMLAQAASTLAAMSNGRFVLGLGIGERINEHVTGAPWPRPGVRRRMLVEAIEILRPLLAGDDVDHEGEFFSVEHAQVFTRAATPPDLWVAVGGPRTAQVAGAQADGMIGLEPAAANVEAFERAGGDGKPVVGQVHVCLADSTEAAIATVRRWWPHQGLAAPLLPELARPEHFAAAVADLDDAALRRAVVCCEGAAPIVEAVAAFGGAGYTHVALHQVGPDQQRLFDVAGKELLDAFR
jgi:coenzyme F420-dependent glucose-6-phosphate dehydrogenase